MRILLVSTYELGHQPLHVAAPAAALRAAGHDVRAVDVAVDVRGADAIDDEMLAWADRIAISVPMHTATRIAIELARRIRQGGAVVPIAVYGLYAHVAAGFADRAITGEYLEDLVAWAADGGSGASVGTAVAGTPVPDRTGLPGLDRYARLEAAGERRLVGYVEGSRGCRHLCRHCPIPPVYGGRYRRVPADVVAEDIARLVALGARHISFGDPDFLNAPAHSRRLIDELHRDFPEVTFDITTKVDLILRHADVWPRWRDAGLQFVVSAFETTNDHVLHLLRKGHTRNDEVAAVHLLQSHGITVRPTWLPFTPWATRGDLVDIVDFIDAHRLDVDPVQLTIRLLIPPGSLLLEDPELAPYLDEYDAESLTWRWRSVDPAMDELAPGLADIVAAGANRDPRAVYADVRDVIYESVGRQAGPLPDAVPEPRLTEPWFC